MSVHAASNAIGAAAHEAHVARSTITSRARHQPRGSGRTHATCPAADDSAEWSTSPAAVNAADTGPEYLSIVRWRCRTAPTVSDVGRTTSSFVFSVNAESPKSHTVTGLSEESIVGDLLGRHLRRVAESDYGDAIDRLGVGDDSTYAYSGVDCETSGATSHYHAICEKYTSSEAGTADCDSACCTSTCRELGRATASALVR